jgi:hypothetical protein
MVGRSLHHPSALIVGALYENDYIKENGRWRILTLKYRPVWHSAYDRGWDKTPHDWVPFFKGPKYPEAEGGPDIVEEPSPDTLWLWPDSTLRLRSC